MDNPKENQGRLPVKLEVVQSGLLGLRRSLGKVKLLRTLGFSIDFSSFQFLETGQRLRLIFHIGKQRIQEFCGYIVSRKTHDREHEYSVALEAEGEELEEMKSLAADVEKQGQGIDSLAKINNG